MTALVRPVIRRATWLGSGAVGDHVGATFETHWDNSKLGSKPGRRKLAAFMTVMLVVALGATMLIGAGVATAGSADPRIALLAAVAAGGAVAGDNLSYLAGRRFGPAAERRFFERWSGRRGSLGLNQAPTDRGAPPN